MDTLFFYRLIDAVRDSLDRAGRDAYSLDRLVHFEAWLNLDELDDFLAETGFQSVPLLWEGRALSEHDEFQRCGHVGKRDLRRRGRTGAILLWKDALLLPLTVLTDDVLTDTIVVAGERRAGAIRELLDAYSEFSRRRSRSSA